MKPTPTLDHQIAMRIPAALMDRIDGHLHQMQSQLPTLRLTRSDAMRDLMERALRQTTTPQQ